MPVPFNVNYPYFNVYAILERSLFIITGAKMRFLSIIALTIGCFQSGYAGCTPLQLVDRIPLPGVTGRIDHLAMDTMNNRLFVAALGNNSLEVIDLREGKRIRSIRGLSEPQGVVFLQGPGRLVVSSGGNGACLVFDAKTLEPVTRLDLREDADNLRYHVAGRELFVAYGNGAVGIFNGSFRKVGDIPLPGHPESFAINRDASRLFINVPAVRAVVVADIRSRRVIDTWKLRDAGGNFPMALDETTGLVLVGARRPSQIIGFDMETGSVAFTVPIDGDPDDIFIDPQRHRIYVSCGAGYLDVLEWNDSGDYRLLEKIPTAPGARTALFVPEKQRLYLAVPHRGQQGAAVWSYAIQ